ncbi:(2Fe-2S)-binding protein, partial [bacterium]|nr:(2Fe-2S)-binding protein [bacterium]
MTQKVTFTVNKKKVTVEIDEKEKLLYTLRERLELVGTKCGCDDATCGACAVVVDGETKKSCILFTKNLENKEVTTIEGLSNGLTLHPVQRALIESGAVQCGFCIPGIVMELYMLFNRNLNANDEEIMEALSEHFCRCTGYEAIF